LEFALNLRGPAKCPYVPLRARQARPVRGRHAGDAGAQLPSSIVLVATAATTSTTMTIIIIIGSSMSRMMSKSRANKGRSAS
jgi:hypothetical protein